mmetsp:Transcript_51339/g.101382  ORF Transcript_51339/g.101382 Transcript_51339/m.101382 type:complete len:226 (-) Transcript_51339:114-791(-)
MELDRARGVGAEAVGDKDMEPLRCRLGGGDILSDMLIIRFGAGCGLPDNIDAPSIDPRRDSDLSGLPLGVFPLLMLFERSIACSGCGSSNAGAFLALVCSVCRRLTTSSISAADLRLFTEELSSSLEAPKLPAKDSDLGVADRRSYSFACSCSVRIMLRVFVGDLFCRFGSTKWGDLAIVLCALRRAKISSPPDTLPLTDWFPPPSGDPMKLPREEIILLEDSGI